MVRVTGRTIVPPVVIEGVGVVGCAGEGVGLLAGCGVAVGLTAAGEGDGLTVNPGCAVDGGVGVEMDPSSEPQETTSKSIAKITHKYDNFFIASSSIL